MPCKGTHTFLHQIWQATAKVESTTGTVVQVFSTGTVVQVFLLARGVATETWSGNQHVDPS